MADTEDRRLDGDLQCGHARCALSGLRPCGVERKVVNFSKSLSTVGTNGDTCKSGIYGRKLVLDQFYLVLLAYDAGIRVRVSIVACLACDKRFP